MCRSCWIYYFDYHPLHISISIFSFDFRHNMIYGFIPWIWNVIVNIRINHHVCASSPRLIYRVSARKEWWVQYDSHVCLQSMKISEYKYMVNKKWWILASHQKKTILNVSYTDYHTSSLCPAFIEAYSCLINIDCCLNSLYQIWFVMPILIVRFA